MYSTSVLPASIVTVSPFDRVTVNGRSSAWLTFTVKEGCWSSVTFPLLTMLTVTASMLSLMTVEAGVGFGVSCSKLPPVAFSMVTLTVEPLL
ncbi:hypothetical protein D3C81_1441650 [compost metagenome]